ncbi:hypothetical protein [Caballeronia sp. M23-90]
MAFEPDLGFRVRPCSFQRAADTGFKIGQPVFHNKFGEGTVIALQGALHR